MTTTLTSATLPVFQTSLSNLSHCLNKAADNAEKRGFNPDVFVSMRLAPDMLPFASQIRIACDAAKNGTARVSGLEAPSLQTTKQPLHNCKSASKRPWIG
jgi:hypothetical protein